MYYVCAWKEKLLKRILQAFLTFPAALWNKPFYYYIALIRPKQKVLEHIRTCPLKSIITNP